MAAFSSMNVIGSGMTAQQVRLDVISENITNMNTTRTEDGGGAYRRKIVTMMSTGERTTFQEILAEAGHDCKAVSNRGYETTGGVMVTEIGEDESELPVVYDPTHPDANEDGYVEMPNVTLVKEITDAMAASQAYNADVTAFNTLKQVMAKGLEIGI